MLIRNVRLWPHGTVPVDVRTAGDTIAQVGPGLRPACPGLRPVGPGLRETPGDEEVIDAEGCALLPGLHDHHVHLRALAAARASVRAGPPDVRTADDFRQALATADAPADGWLRCTGYHESVAGDLDRFALDRLLPGRRPVRVQHRTGALWILNSAAVNALRLDDCDLSGVERDDRGVPTGRLWRLDQWLAGRVPSAAPDLGAVSRDAAAQGVTGFTDATPGASQRDVDSLASDGTIIQRLFCMAPPEVNAPGPVKIMLDDDRLPSLDDLTGQVRAARTARRPVAVHCVTRVQLVLTLTALDEAGRHPGDRVEHGAIIPADLIPALRGLTVVTQPHFAAERGDQYAADVAAGDLPDLWRLRSLLEAGLSVAAGSDAPFGGADPWRIAVAAARRPRFAEQGDERVSPETALSLFCGWPGDPATPRTVTPGQPADLVLLRVSPAEVPRRLDDGDTAGVVAASFIGGQRAGS